MKLRSCLRTSAIVLIALCSMASAAMAQIQYYNINTSQFPKITASYQAFNQAGTQTTGLSAKDFEVTEDIPGLGKIPVTATVTQKCIPDTTNGDATILIVIDQSFSMNDAPGPGKPSRWKYVQDAVANFVKQIRFTGNTRVAVVAFSTEYAVWLPSHWTKDYQEVIDTLNKKQPTGGTRYRLPFEEKKYADNVFALFDERPADIPRYIFWLTDGYPQDFEDIYKGREWADSIGRRLQEKNVRFFSITTMESMTHYTLGILAGATGGKSYVANEDELFNLFELLALETQLKELCSISWIAPYGCTELSRNRKATIKCTHIDVGITRDITYEAPPTSIAKINVSDPTLYCGDPTPSGYSFTNLKYTTQNAPNTITGFTVTPPGFFAVDKILVNGQPRNLPVTIAPGDTMSVVVKFTQGEQRIFRSAVLQAQGSPCPPISALVGGSGVVRLTTPAGGEVYNTCDTVTIKWIGVKPTQTVVLEYSTDDGRTWVEITNKATNLSYKWLPKIPATKYLVRASVSPVSEVQWATQLGGAGNDSIASVAVCNDGATLFAGGWFTGNGEFGKAPPAKLFKVTNDVADIEGYLVRLTSDGDIDTAMFLIGTGSNTEKITGVITDSACNVYVLGYFTSLNASLGPNSMQLASQTTQAGFVYKFNRALEMQWSAMMDGNDLRRSYVEPTTIGLRMVNGKQQVIVAGTFQRYVHTGVNATNVDQQSSIYATGEPHTFYTVYDAASGLNSSFSENSSPPAANTRYASLTGVDDQKMNYQGGTFTGNYKDFGPPPTPAIRVIGKGGTDSYIYKFGAPPASSDTSGVFEVGKSELTFEPATFTLDPIAQGQSKQTVYSKLKNTGTLPIRITKAMIMNELDGKDFRLLTNLDSILLKPGQEVSLEFEFAPTGVGIRNGKLLVDIPCGNDPILVLQGTGLPPCKFEMVSSKTLGKRPLGSEGPPEVYTVLTNLGPKDLIGTLSFSGRPEDLAELPIEYRVGSTDPFTPWSAPVGFSIPSDDGTTPKKNVLQLRVTPKPATEGQKKLNINFALAAECEAGDANIVMEVIVPSVNISDLPFGLKRLKTISKGVVVITNNNVDEVLIESVSADETGNLSDGIKKDPALPWPTAPFSLAPGAKKELAVIFEPIVRGFHKYLVNAKVQGKADPIVGTVTGTGYLPVIAAAGSDFGQVSVNILSGSQVAITIRNTDASAPLNIYSISAPDLPEFQWLPAPANLPVTIQPNDFVEYYGTFKPGAVRKYTANVVIEHDAKEGPDDLPPYATTTVQLLGEGISPSTISPIDFGNVLGCTTKSADVTIKNPNKTTSMICTGIKAAGDSTQFSLTGAPTGSFTVPPDGSISFKVNFKPTALGPYSVSYTIENDQDQELVINASGTSVSEMVAFQFRNVPQAQAGRQLVMPVFVDLGPMINGYIINTLTFTFNHDSKFARFNHFEQLQAGWSPNPALEEVNSTTIRCTSASPTTNGFFGNAVFDIFLTNEETLGIGMSVRSDEYCIVSNTDTASVSMILTCNSANRLVKFGAQNFSMNPAVPNPVSDKATVQYSTGLELPTTFQVVSQDGRIVKEFVLPAMPSAKYEIDIPTTDIATGLYWVRMSCGPYTRTQMMSIVK